MKLVIDKNIPYAREVFRPFGELHLLDPDDINSSTVNNAEILIIRSVTGVNASLLAGSKVRFVATVSTGCDHVDLKYLKKNNIFFTAAPGGNANSVAEYVITVLAIMAGRKSFSFPEIKLGVVGVGNIGRRVAEKANSLGIRVLKNDPPQKKLTGDPRLLPLEKLMDCDIITLHVPLTEEGRFATRNFFDEARLFKMKKDTILINSSRGGVIEENGLRKALTENRLTAAVLDVWPNEPAVEPQLVNLCEIATPHIAGYSLEGRTNGVVMIFNKLNSFLNTSHDLRLRLPEPENKNLFVDPAQSPRQALAAVLKKSCNIEKDDRDLRKITAMQHQEIPAYFKSLRTNYRTRHEFKNYTVHLPGRTSPLTRQLKSLGFNTREKD